MLFGVKEPGGSTVFEIARNDTDANLDWGDLQLDTGVSDETRLYMAALVKENPNYELPNNLGDVLYTTDFGMKYGQVANFTFDTLVFPKTVAQEEVTSMTEKIRIIFPLIFICVIPCFLLSQIITYSNGLCPRVKDIHMSCA